MTQDQKRAKGIRKMCYANHLNQVKLATFKVNFETIFFTRVRMFVLHMWERHIGNLSKSQFDNAEHYQI